MNDRKNVGVFTFFVPWSQVFPLKEDYSKVTEMSSS
jgi:hypothetical protein